MKRRNFLGKAAAAAVSIAFSSKVSRAQKRNDSSLSIEDTKKKALGTLPTPNASIKPNIIIIMADDLGFGDLSCFGSESIATPNIDRLAHEGVKLTSFHASGPVCSPSRAGLLTGRYPIRSNVTNVYHPASSPTAYAYRFMYEIGYGMPTDEITLAQAIKPAGYASGCIGKWHLGDQKKFRPHHRGFDHFFGVLFSNDMPQFNLYRNDEIVEAAPIDQDYLTRKYTEEAISWIEDKHKSPFLLYLAHTFPHRPLHASPEFQGKSKAGLYGDSVEEIDWSTGEIMKTLDRLGIANNTLVFFTSDNGPWYQGSAGGTRGRKSETFSGGMRIPGIVRWPGVIPAGTVCDGNSMNIDLFATALSIAGVELPNDRSIDGRNILPMLTKKEVSPHKALFFYKDKKLQAVLSGKWKYHRRHPGWATSYFFVPMGPFLFNLEHDPSESYDVSHKYPEKVLELESLMEEWEKGLGE